MPTINTAVGGIAFEISGASGDPCVVFASALGTDRRLWQRQVEAVPAGYRALVYDHPGHGASTLGDPGRSWDTAALAHGVVELLDALGMERFAFVGLSLGGSVGLQLALDCPQRVSRLVCCCARADSPEPYAALWRSRIEKVRSGGMPAIAVETLAKWFPDQAHLPLQTPPFELARDMLEATSVDGYVACASTLTRLDLLGRLPRLAVPCHFLAGESDAAISPAVVAELHAKVPGSSYTILPGAGHLANLDRPEEFSTWLARCLADNDHT